MSTDTKLSKAPISKMTQSGEIFCSMLGNFCKKLINDLAIPLARDNLPGLVSNLASNAMKNFEIKISGKGAVRAGKGFILFISNENMNDIIKIIKWLKDSGVLIDGVTETVKHEIKRQEGGFLRAFLAPFPTSIVQPDISSVVKGISGKGVRRQRINENKVQRINEYKFLFPLHSLSNIKTTNYFNYEPRFDDAFSRNNLSRLKDWAYVINLDGKKVYKHIGFHYLLTEIQVSALFLLQVNKFNKKC